MEKITPKERENMVHQWKILTGRGDLGEAALIKKKLEANPLTPKVIVTSNLEVAETPKVEEALPGTVLGKKKGTGKRGRPPGVKNKKK